MSVTISDKKDFAQSINELKSLIKKDIIMQMISLILLDSDLTGGWYYPTFEHLGPS